MKKKIYICIHAHQPEAGRDNFVVGNKESEEYYEGISAIEKEYFELVEIEDEAKDDEEYSDLENTQC